MSDKSTCEYDLLVANGQDRGGVEYDKLGMLELIFIILISHDWSAFSYKGVQFLPYMVPKAMQPS